MNQFDQAKAKYEKNRQNQGRALPKVEEPVLPAPEKKEVKAERKVEVMRITVEGPVPLSFELHFAGTLLASQINEKTLRELFKKHLAPIGRIL